eukprot:UC4_evm4s1546
MTERWISQERHWCKFCKCWLGGSRQSIAFHENGKNHKYNVQCYIQEKRKQSKERQEAADEVSAGIRELEREAMDKMRKDIEANPILAKDSAFINATRPQHAKPISSKSKSIVAAGAVEAAIRASALRKLEYQCGSVPARLFGDWIENTTPEGYIYYYNTKTQVSQWEKPQESKKAEEPVGLIDVTSQDTSKDESSNSRATLDITMVDSKTNIKSKNAGEKKLEVVESTGYSTWVIASEKKTKGEPSKTPKHQKQEHKKVEPQIVERRDSIEKGLLFRQREMPEMSDCAHVKGKGYGENHLEQSCTFHKKRKIREGN